MRIASIIWLAASLASTCGCGGSAYDKPPGEKANGTSPAVKQEAGSANVATTPITPPPGQPAAPATPPGTTAQVNPAPAPAPAPVEPDREVASGTSGKKGRGYGGGIITEPIRQKFIQANRIVFDIQIPEALKLYKAEHERGPKSHEEFMRVMIKGNQISLPELPEGDRYYYDVETEELMVEHPPQ